MKRIFRGTVSTVPLPAVAATVGYAAPSTSPAPTDRRVVARRRPSAGASRSRYWGGRSGMQGLLGVVCVFALAVFSATCLYAPGPIQPDTTVVLTTLPGDTRAAAQPASAPVPASGGRPLRTPVGTTGPDEAVLAETVGFTAPRAVGSFSLAVFLLALLGSTAPPRRRTQRTGTDRRATGQASASPLRAPRPAAPPTRMPGSPLMH